MECIEVKPIENFENLLKWNGVSESEASILNTIDKYSAQNIIKTNRPKTLICHDMKGGYLEDRFCLGSTDKDAYRFFNWSGVDGFIYFSHSFITIPPVGWIQAAHKNKTKVFGTLITEWDDGEKLCKLFLSDENTIKETVSKLVELATVYKFEGWLINIENKLDEGLVLNMVEFLNLLTKEMHSNIKDSEVIWYDSVTQEGKLEWQNKLNHLNKCFFDVCDGIFLNYTWTIECLETSKEIADDRYSDVYVGIDVFGRNFFEGGGFNTYKALEVARNKDLSVAIFAQGWTFEFHGLVDFLKNEDKLWKSLDPFLYHKTIQELPFKTNFCQGFGKSKFKLGKTIEHSQWYDLRLMEYQPIWSKPSDIKMYPYDNDAFNGGCCILLEASSPNTICLFKCDIKMKKYLKMSVVYKWISKECDLEFNLTAIKDRNDATVHEDNYSFKLKMNSTTDNLKENPTNSFLIKENSSEVINEWISKEFIIRETNILLQDISLRFKSKGKLLLGEICLQLDS